MIVKEFYMTRLDGVNLYRTYSTDHYYIKQLETGIIYVDAIDVENIQYTYLETNQLIQDEGSNIVEV